MNPVILGDENQHAFKDAIFFSGHKFLGGLGELLFSYISDY